MSNITPFGSNPSDLSLPEPLSKQPGSIASYFRAQSVQVPDTVLITSPDGLHAWSMASRLIAEFNVAQTGCSGRGTSVITINCNQPSWVVESNNIYDSGGPDYSVSANSMQQLCHAVPVGCNDDVIWSRRLRVVDLCQSVNPLADITASINHHYKPHLTVFIYFEPIPFMGPILSQ